MTKPSIQINQLSFSYPQTQLAIKQWSYTFHQQCYGIIGDNGLGKTAMLRLLIGDLVPTSGSIHIDGSCHYLYQHIPQKLQQASIAKLLAIEEILHALANIEQGSCDASDFDTVGNHWMLKQQLTTLFNQFELSGIDIHTPVSQLSGGEKTKIQLIAATLKQADFILMDEPSNNLDSQTKHLLFDFIENYPGGVILVSHDRELLNHATTIVELSQLGIKQYGGNYDDYYQQKTIETEAAQHQLQNSIDQLHKRQQSAQLRLERHQQNQAKGLRAKKEQIKARGSYDKLAFKSAKGRSENSNQRIRNQAQRQVESLSQQMQQAKTQVEVKEQIHANLAKTEVASNKVVVAIDKLHFNYPNQKACLTNYNANIIGPERIALHGNNGSGKSTLIKLIVKQLKPTAGTINTGVNTIGYFDQQVSMLDNQLDLVDNYLAINPDSNINDAYCALAAFNFRNTQANKLASQLSGGERMRAGLAITLMSQTPPQLLILDEPTNHLDITSIEAIEKIINQYQGAILCVSHDSHFLNNCHINKHWQI